MADQQIAAKFAIEEASDAINQQIGKLDGFVAALRTRLSFALQLLRSTDGTASETNAEAETITKVLAAVGAVISSVHQIGLRLRAFTMLAQNRGNHPKPDHINAQMSRLAGELRELIAKVQSSLGSLPYPFPHPRGQLTVVDYARYEKPCQHEWETAYHESNSHLERLSALHYRLLGRLLVIADFAEKSIELNAQRPATAAGLN